MNILAIETSCDETAIAVLNVTGKNPQGIVLSHHVATQVALHEQYGGVFPMMAKREHARVIVPLAIKAMKEAGILELSRVPTIDRDMKAKIEHILEREQEMLGYFLELLTKYKIPKKIDKIVVTVGPGLAPALWVGISFAKALALFWDLPLAPVNHMEGHILSVAVPAKAKEPFLISQSKDKLPAISLLVSGGHTEIVLMEKMGVYTLLGQTRDDAAGEAFDKVARMLGMPYPGGPHISRLADEDRAINPKPTGAIELPRPMLHTNDFDFSFSGLKTAVLYFIRDNGEPTDEMKRAIAREFEDAAVDVLVAKTIAAAEGYSAQNIIVGGGVSANKELAKRLTEAGVEKGFTVVFPTKNVTTDNAIMIAIAGYFAKPEPISSKSFMAQGNLSF